jgi:hypothetical protein
MKKAEIVSELERSLMEEVSWRQKTRVLCLRVISVLSFFKLWLILT